VYWRIQVSAQSVGSEHSPQLSTQSRSTPLLFDLRWTAVTSISCVWITFGRPQNPPRRVPRSGFVGAPSPARTGPRRAQAEQSRVSTPLASLSHVWRWPGWDHYRPQGCSGGRPRLGGTPVRDETVPAGCPRTGGGPVTPRLPRIRPRSAKAGHSGHIWPPGPGFGDHTASRRLDLELPPFVAIPSPGQRTTASRVGTRQRRARPRRSCPQAGDGRQRNPGDRYCCQPGHLHTRRAERAGRPHRRPGPCARSASGTGRERRAKPNRRDQVGHAYDRRAGHPLRRLDHVLEPIRHSLPAGRATP
jgi:hypothetical protein